MKTLISSTVLLGLLCGPQAWADASNYVNFVRQVQFPSGLEYQMTVIPADSKPSQLAIDPGGARFELTTTDIVSGVETPLASTYVGTYTPVAQIEIFSEDLSAAIPRTRADRPFLVRVTVPRLRAPGDDVPEAATKVKFLQHVQSYGVKGTHVGLDRSQALMVSQSYISEEGPHDVFFPINTVPGGDRTKVRGEQRFTAWSLPDTIAPESQLSSAYIQIWPMADGSMAGIAMNEEIRFKLPQLTLTINDVYPGSTIYAQVYKGEKVDGAKGTVVPGSAYTNKFAVPEDKVLVIDDYGAIFDEEGRWTMELMAVTPYWPARRLDWVPFDLDRSIHMNGSFTTIETD
jgi:hypothetical protein